MTDNYYEPDDEFPVDELDVADEVAMADTGRRWAPRLMPGQREAGAA